MPVGVVTLRSLAPLPGRPPVACAGERPGPEAHNGWMAAVLLERDAEVRALERCLAELAAGQGGVVAVEAAPGLG